MSDTFQLPVTYNGEEKEFPAQLLRFGYTHKVHVGINGITVILNRMKSSITGLWQTLMLMLRYLLLYWRLSVKPFRRYLNYILKTSNETPLLLSAFHPLRTCSHNL